jgi:hypothetical protein
MSHIRETSKVTINTSYFHPAHQHYTDEAQKAETVPSVVIYIYIYIYGINFSVCKVIIYLWILQLFIITQTILLISQTGSEFDENGNVRNWWTNKSRENFVKRSTCLINQYNKVKLFGYKVCTVSCIFHGDAVIGIYGPFPRLQKYFFCIFPKILVNG